MPEKENLITSISYQIDSNNCLVSTSSSWDQFAQANDGEQASASHVVNHNLFDYIEGSEERFLYQLMLDFVRTKHSDFTLAFRCDSPDEKRLFQMKLSDQQNHSVKFDNTLLFAEPSETTVVLEPLCDCMIEMLHICSYCFDIRIDNNWVGFEKGLAELRIFEAKHLPKISHGMCPNCSQRLNPKYQKQ
ncbi:MAG: hypothetical protein V2I33_07485 [Kangiellaceae bacterium]|jgi:hypothetical protein|nr:hypothetical protein [Kangiellaceae bacterium]